MGLIAVQFALHLRLKVLAIFINDKNDEERIQRQIEWLRNKYGDYLSRLFFKLF